MVDEATERQGLTLLKEHHAFQPGTGVLGLGGSESPGRNGQATSLSRRLINRALPCEIALAQAVEMVAG